MEKEGSDNNNGDEDGADSHKGFDHDYGDHDNISKKKDQW